MNIQIKKIALFQSKEIQQWEVGEIARIKNLLDVDTSAYFEIVDNYVDADLLVLIESCIVKNQNNLEDYKKIINFSYSNGKKLFVINYEDTPSGILPGFYSSLEQKNFNSLFHRSWPHLRLPNELIDTNINQYSGNDDLLFSFSGSCSHPVRKILFNTYPTINKKYSVREIKRWYNHELNEKAAYIDEILRSKFVLCPRGIALYSHRILETLALGRVPVIIADDWIPFTIQENDYYIQIKESKISKIEEILEFHLPLYDKFKGNAKFVYKKYFNDNNRYSVILNEIIKLEESLPNEINSIFLIDRFRSSNFFKLNDWLINQRFKKSFKKIVRILIKNCKILLYSHGK